MRRRIPPAHHGLHLVAGAGDSVPTAADALLERARLDAYALALELQQAAAAMVTLRTRASLGEQLERASAALLTELAEGADRPSAPERSRHYALARGTAAECAAVVDALRARRLVDAAAAAHLRSLVLRMARLLRRLGTRFRARDRAGSARPAPGRARWRTRGH